MDMLGMLMWPRVVATLCVGVLALASVGHASYAQEPFAGISKVPRPAKAARKTSSPPATAAAKPVKRDIIGLYDSAAEPAPAVTRLHKLLELPLNHLGYRVIYWDLAKGVPPADVTRQAHGFATWFSQRASNVDAYFAWARAAIQDGLKAVIIEQPGMLGASAELPAINSVLSKIGLDYADYYVSNISKTSIAASDPGMIGFEQPLRADLLAHHVVRARSSDVRRHLVLADPAHAWAKADGAVQVATSPRGGFIAPGFAARYDQNDNRQRWIVNPFVFLTAALGPTAFPIPDTTTVSGRRMYFSHIDGDGWNGRAAVAPGDPLEGRASADLILRDLIEPFPDLPVSVGLISSDIDPAHGGEARAAETARRYFKLPQVEVASHTHTHPFDWGFFSAYDRKIELQRLLGLPEADRPLADRALMSVIKAARGQGLTPLPLAEGAVYTLPRVKVHKPFSLDDEVRGALETSTSLAPRGKTAQLYLWSGNTSPGEEIIRATRAAGVRNLNGGDARLDRAYPSVSSVPAIGKPVGAERQIYAAASNEFTYTNNWTGPFDGFAALAETVANTETPRRLKPFNIYYHMYSASRVESLAAVKQNLMLARASRVAPVTAATYAAIADSFYDVAMVETGPRTWRVTNRGALQTLRFDDEAASLVPDYAASRGVIGHTRHAGSLYVALDSAVDVVTLKLDPAGKTTRAASNPWLMDSRWRLSDVTAETCRVAGRAQGFGAGEMTWGQVKRGRWQFTVAGQRVEAVVGADGVLSLTLPGSAIDTVAFEGRCS
jgi:polysaccharide biosynthesis protein PelA